MFKEISNLIKHSISAFPLLAMFLLIGGCAHESRLYPSRTTGVLYTDSIENGTRAHTDEGIHEELEENSGRRPVQSPQESLPGEVQEYAPLDSDHDTESISHEYPIPPETQDQEASAEAGLEAEASLAPTYEDNENNGNNPLGAIETATAHTENTAHDKQGELDEALGLCQEAQEEWKAGNADVALELLDRAYEFLIKVETNGDAEIFQQKEDIRYLISRRIVEIYASRKTVVAGNHNEIPLIMNDIIEQEIKSFLNKERDFFLESYARSASYRPMILNELKKAGLPERLSWLPLIESGYLIRALSRSRALGLWQFIPSTGYKFGLVRDRWIDERMDPVKSTRAAIEYLTQLHNIFGDWTTALAAYNCGEGTVLRVIREQHINYLDNFWDLYVHLPSETARYVPRFMAAIHLIEHPEQYGLEIPSLQESITYNEISVGKQLQLADLALKLAMEPKELIDMNPELRYRVTPDAEYMLKVPVNKAEAALAAVADMPEWRAPEPNYAYHRVRQGETLSTIAQKYRTSIKKIALANNLRRYDRLRIGQRLKITSRKVSTAALTQAGSGGEIKSFKVRKGDCAYDIARMHGMSLEEFLALNNLTSESVIHPGQTVLVRGR